MRHTMRRTIHFLAFALLLPLWPAGDVDAQFNGALRGDYNMTMERFCKVRNVTTNTPKPDLHIVVRGTWNFDGSGSGTFSGQILVPDFPTVGSGLIGNQANEACTGVYTVNSDGTFMYQPTCNLTFTAGELGGASAVGATGSLSGIQLQGRLSLDGTVLLLSDTAVNTETLTWTSGPLNGQVEQHECNSSGVATSRR